MEYKSKENRTQKETKKTRKGASTNNTSVSDIETRMEITPDGSVKQTIQRKEKSTRTAHLMEVWTYNGQKYSLLQNFSEQIKEAYSKIGRDTVFTTEELFRESKVSEEKNYQYLPLSPLISESNYYFTGIIEGNNNDRIDLVNMDYDSQSHGYTINPSTINQQGHTLSNSIYYIYCQDQYIGYIGFSRGSKGLIEKYLTKIFRESNMILSTESIRLRHPIPTSIYDAIRDIDEVIISAEEGTSRSNQIEGQENMNMDDIGFAKITANLIPKIYEIITGVESSPKRKKALSSALQTAVLKTQISFKINKDKSDSSTQIREQLIELYRDAQAGGLQVTAICEKRKISKDSAIISGPLSFYYTPGTSSAEEICKALRAFCTSELKKRFL